MRAQLLDGRHHVRRQDDGTATLCVVGEDLADVGRGHGVDGLERLVEDQDSRRVNEGGSQGDLLRHARRIVTDQLFASLGQVEGCEELVGALAGDGGVQAVEHAHMDEEVWAGEPVEEAHPVGHDAEQAACPLRVAPHVDPVHVGGAAIGSEQAGGHGQRRGLSGAVRPDDSVEGSGGDVEGQVRDGDEVAIDLDEASDRQCDIFPDGGDGYRRNGRLRIGHEILLHALKYPSILREVQGNAAKLISDNEFST